MIKKSLSLVVLAFMALMSVGCGCGPKPLNVTVELDDAMRARLESRKIEVHIVAVNSKQNERWENYSMTKYWQPGNEVRESVPTAKMIFDPANSAPQTLAKTDPIWAKWLADSSGEDNMKLYVLALLPGLNEDAPGDKDARRQILPLGSCHWKDTNVRLKVQQTGIITITPPIQQH